MSPMDLADWTGGDPFLEILAVFDTVQRQRDANLGRMAPRCEVVVGSCMGDSRLPGDGDICVTAVENQVRVVIDLGHPRQISEVIGNLIRGVGQAAHGQRSVSQGRSQGRSELIIASHVNLSHERHFSAVRTDVKRFASQRIAVTDDCGPVNVVDVGRMLHVVAKNPECRGRI